MPHWLAHWLGLDDPSGRVYLFLSGAGPFLLKGSLLVLVWHHLNCREPKCKRLARHAHDGYCRKHYLGRVK